MRVKIDKEMAAETKDVHAFTAVLQKKGCFMRFKTDESDRITCVFWGTPDEKKLLARFGSVIVVVNTFNTNM